MKSMRQRQKQHYVGHNNLVHPIWIVSYNTVEHSKEKLINSVLMIMDSKELDLYFHRWRILIRCLINLRLLLFWNLNMHVKSHNIIRLFRTSTKRSLFWLLKKVYPNYIPSIKEKLCFCNSKFNNWEKIYLHWLPKQLATNKSKILKRW